MPYIIDGHNLIPNIPWLSLESIDDEKRLIELLQEFCRRQRKEISVYFDNAQPGQPPARILGGVTAYFVRPEVTADQAIRRRLIRLGSAARNWTVVSSDLAVQGSAREVHARVLPSSTFASLLQQALNEDQQENKKRPEVTENAEEIDEWLKLFDSGENQE